MFRSIPVVVLTIVAGALLSQATNARADESNQVEFRVARYDVRTHARDFKVDEVAEIKVTAHGNALLEIHVQDENGIDIACIDKPASVLCLRFTPRCNISGSCHRRYTILIKNCTDREACYKLAHN